MAVLCYRDWSKKITQDQNLTNNKKSTIFELSSWAVILAKFHDDTSKIVDFLLLVKF